MFIRNLLKKILPMSSQSLNGRLDNFFLEFEKKQEENSERLYSFQKELRKHFSEVNNADNEVEKKISILNNTIYDLTKHLCDIESTIKTSDEKITVIGELISDLGSQTSSIEKSVSDLEKHFSSLESKINVIEKRIAKLETRTNQIHTLQYNHLDPELYAHAIKMWYQDLTGNILDLDNPVGYNAKIQWMKVYDRDPRKTLLTDKYLVRDWVKEKIGEKYLIPLYGVYRSADDINFETLPDSFVLKANHGSGMNYIVRDKHTENLNAIRTRASGWLNDNFTFHAGYELQYNDIPRRLIIEQYLENIDGDMPDYKLWCFDGRCRFIELIRGRRSKEGAHLGFFDINWEPLSFTTGVYPKINENVKRPNQLEEMVYIAEKLSFGFAHVRVDLYLMDDGTIKFGEMTFTTSSGTNPWNPPEADLWVGEMFKLPQQNTQKPATFK